MSPLDKKCLYSLEFYRKSIWYAYGIGMFGGILNLVCFENEYISEIVTKVLILGFNLVSIGAASQIIESTQALLEI